MNDPRSPFSTDNPIQIDRARNLFNALSADGDKPKPDLITIADLEGYHPAETFEEFLNVNQITTFEEIIR